MQELHGFTNATAAVAQVSFTLDALKNTTTRSCAKRYDIRRYVRNNHIEASDRNHMSIAPLRCAGTDSH